MTIINALDCIRRKVPMEGRLAFNDRMLTLLQEMTELTPQHWDTKKGGVNRKITFWCRTLMQGDYNYTTSWYERPDTANLEMAIHYLHNDPSRIAKLYRISEDEGLALLLKYNFDGHL